MINTSINTFIKTLPQKEQEFILKNFELTTSYITHLMTMNKNDLDNFLRKLDNRPIK